MPMGIQEILRKTRGKEVWEPLACLMVGHLVTGLAALGFASYFLAVGDMKMVVLLMVPVLFTLGGWVWFVRTVRSLGHE